MKVKVKEIIINAELLHLQQAPVYLYSIKQAAKMCRQRQVDFAKDYLQGGFPVVRIKRSNFIRLEDLRRYQDQFIVVQAS